NLPAARLLPSSAGRGTLRSDLLRLVSSIGSNNFNIKRFTPLLKTVLNHKLDKKVWSNTVATVIEPTPPLRPLPFHI
ncbi:hypothetical protein AOQ84DRAFT_321004, partial [Glonium stellatum]